MKEIYLENISRDYIGRHVNVYRDKILNRLIENVPYTERKITTNHFYIHIFSIVIKKFFFS